MVRNVMFGLVVASLVSVAQASEISVTVNGKDVRLWGIDAPSSGETCTTAAGRIWHCGARVRGQLRALLAEDKPICDARTDGSVLCRVAGLDIGLLLVKEGLAKSTGPYDDAQTRARSAKVGIWE